MKLIKKTSIVVVGLVVVIVIASIALSLSGRTLASKGNFNQVPHINGLQLTVQGVQGRYLKVENVPRLKTKEDFDSYITQRREKLNQLASESPERQIEVAISPSHLISLEDFGSKASSHGLTIEELSLDIFINGKWDRMVWFDKTTALLDISEDAKSLAERVIEIESSRPQRPQKHLLAANEQTQSGVDFSNRKAQEGVPLSEANAQVAIRFVRGTVAAVSAVKFQEDESILLVDPITDIQESLRERAREIKVTRMPHLYVEREIRFGALYSLNGAERNRLTKQSQDR